MYLVAMPIITFIYGKSSTVSYGNSCFGVLEVRHVFFGFTVCELAPESLIIF